MGYSLGKKRGPVELVALQGLSATHSRIAHPKVQVVKQKSSWKCGTQVMQKNNIANLKSTCLLKIISSKIHSQPITQG